MIPDISNEACQRVSKPNYATDPSKPKEIIIKPLKRRRAMYKRYAVPRLHATPLCSFAGGDARHNPNPG